MQDLVSKKINRVKSTSTRTSILRIRSKVMEN